MEQDTWSCSCAVKLLQKEKGLAFFARPFSVFLGPQNLILMTLVIKGGLFSYSSVALEYERKGNNYRFYKIGNCVEVINHSLCVTTESVETYILLDKKDIKGPSILFLKREGFYEAFPLKKTPTILCTDGNGGLISSGADPNPCDLHFKDTLNLVYLGNGTSASDDADDVLVHTNVWNKDKGRQVPGVKKYKIQTGI